MKKLFHRLFFWEKSELKKNAAVLLGGNGLAQIITVLVYPIVARLYAPSAFGQLAVIFGIHSLLVILSTGKYDMAVVIPQSDKDASKLVSTGIRIAMILSAAILPVVLIIRYAPDWLHLNFHVSVWYLLLPLSVITAAYIQLQTGWCTRFKLFKIIVSTTFVLYILTAVIKIFLGFLNVEDGLLYAFFISQVGASAYLFVRIRKSHQKQILHPFSPDIMRVAREYSNFPKFNLPISLINSFSANLPIYFLAIFFSDDLTGQFSLAFTILFRPIGVYNNSVYQVLFQRVMEMRHQNKAVWPFLKKYILKSLFVLLAGGLIIVAFIPGIVQVYLGPNFRVSGTFCQLMLPWAILLIPAGSLAFVPNIFKRQSRAFVIEVVYLLIRLAALLIGYFFNNVILSIGLFSLTGVGVVLYRLVWYRNMLIDADRRIDDSN